MLEFIVYLKKKTLCKINHTNKKCAEHTYIRQRMTLKWAVCTRLPGNEGPYFFEYMLYWRMIDLFSSFSCSECFLPAYSDFQGSIPFQSWNSTFPITFSVHPRDGLWNGKMQWLATRLSRQIDLWEFFSGSVEDERKFQLDVERVNC